MTNGLLIYGYIFAHFLINFLKYKENCVFFFISVQYVTFLIQFGEAHFVIAWYCMRQF
jgi:hypothetical protein